MHVQEGQAQLQQCDGACVQPTHFVGGRVGKRLGETREVFVRSLIFRTTLPSMIELQLFYYQTCVQLVLGSFEKLETHRIFS